MLLSILFLGNTASKTLQTYFPVKVLPVSMCCMLFFGTLSSTGTITVLTHKIARKIKGSKAAVAVFVVYFSTLIVNFCIGSSNAILYAMTPFAVGLMIELGLNPTMGALAVWAGFNSSGFLPWENQGIINGGLANTSFGEPVGNLTMWNATGLLNVFFILMLSVAAFYVLRSGYMGKSSTYDYLPLDQIICIVSSSQSCEVRLLSQGKLSYESRIYYRTSNLMPTLLQEMEAGRYTSLHLIAKGVIINENMINRVLRSNGIVQFEMYQHAGIYTVGRSYLHLIEEFLGKDNS